MSRSVFHQALLILLTSLLTLSAEMACSQVGKDSQSKPLNIGGQPIVKVLLKLGAQIEDGISLSQLESYSRQFGFGDRNRDGRHSKAEYIDNGNYLTPMARRGIFNASDGDRDGYVSRDEYVLNRIITDEAKKIIQKTDLNRDGQIDKKEFVASAMDDRELAAKVFDALDTNRDGQIATPEYLRVWGQWARASRGNAEDRLTKRKNELLDPGFSSLLLQHDKNGDGKVDAGELQEFLKMFDRDGDGMLDRKELNAVDAKNQTLKR
jgi:Ca2+-binding EF-hand superfamily protein